MEGSESLIAPLQTSPPLFNGTNNIYPHFSAAAELGKQQSATSTLSKTARR